MVMGVRVLQVKVATKAVSCGSDMMISISDVIRGHVLQRLWGHNSPIRVSYDCGHGVRVEEY